MTLFTTLRTASLCVVLATAAAGSALADGHWDRGRRHGWGHHRDDWDGPRVIYVAPPPPRVIYAPPPRVVYAPPPVVYASPPVVYEPAPSINLVFPLR